jgi:hypothetical protein
MSHHAFAASRRLAAVAMLALLFVALVPANRAEAQTTSGTLVGTVLDAQGNGVAGARVTVVNEINQNSRSTVTGADGGYRIPFLPPGRYTIRAVTQGFAENSISGFPIPLNQATNLVPPITLSPVGGAPTATTTTAPAATTPATSNAQALPGGGQTEGEARASVVNTNDPTRRGNYDLRMLQSIPVPEFRTFDDFALLTAGVSRSPETLGNVQGPGIGAGIGTAGQFSVNGQRPRSNNFTVDGSDNNDPDVGVRRQGFVTLVPQSIESVQEFQISTLLWDAELGRNLGSQVNVVTRSGGERVSGQVYGFFNDSALNAKNFFDLESEGVPAANPVVAASDGTPVFLDGNPLVFGAPVQGENPYTRYQVGFVLGGPIVEQKTHYFLSLEYQHLNAGVEQNFAVPTAEERGFGGSGAEGLVFLNPETGVPIVGAFPTTRVGDAVFSLYPFPNNPYGPYGRNTYTEVLPADARGLVWSAKVDHDFNAWDRDHTLSARYNFTDDDRIVPSVGNAIYSTITADTRTQNLSLVLNSSLSPNLFNLLRASYGRTELGFGERRHPNLVPSSLDYPFLLNSRVRGNFTFPIVNDNGSVTPDVPTFTTLTAGTTEDYLGPIGQVSVLPFSTVGVDVYTFPQDRVSNTFQVADTMAWTWNAHQIKFGPDIRYVQLNSRQDRNFRPIAVFAPAVNLSAFFPGNQQFPLRNPLTGADPLASAFLTGADLAALGAPSNVFQVLSTDGASDSTIGLRFWETNFFVQDDFKVRPNFTVNLGLRYEYTTVPHEENSRIENTFTGQLADIRDLETVLGGRTDIYESDWNNFGPRVGFAWDPWGDGRTSVRGGFGIYYDAILGAVVSQSRNVVPTFLPVSIALSTIQAQFPNLLLSPSIFAAPGTLNQLGPNFNLREIQAINQVIGGGAGLAFTLPERDLETPYAQQFGLTIEREIGADFAASAAYAGVLSRHLLRANMPNQGPNAIPVVRQIDPFFNDDDQFTGEIVPIGVGLSPTPVGQPFFSGRSLSQLGAFTLFESSGRSSYHGLQLELRKRYSDNYTFTAAYTWSHSIDDASDVFDLAGSSAQPQDPFRLDLEKADSNFDVRHRFAHSFTWDIPLFRDANGIEEAIFGNWRISDRVEIQSGTPYTVNTVLDANLNGLLTDRPQTDAGLREADEGPLQLVALGDATDYVVFGGGNGAVGRNTFRTRMITNVDLAVSKFVTFTETTNLEIRTEFFNLFNATNFGIPVRQMESPGFGYSTYTVTPARQIQFAARLSF